MRSCEGALRVNIFIIVVAGLCFIYLFYAIARPEAVAVIESLYQAFCGR